MSEPYIDRLWTPGQIPQDVYHQPGPAEFCLHFANTVWNGVYDEQQPFVSLEGSLSALRTPDKPPTAVAILDLDDMVGNLGSALRQLQYSYEDHRDPEYFTHNYGHGIFFNDDDTAVKLPLIRLVKSHGMQPVEEIDSIRSMITSWRAAGVYVAFVTSAVAGAELSHIDFVAEHLNKQCDGMIITSGDYMLVDKGKAAAEIVAFTGASNGTPVVHIDDLPHNTRNVRTTLQALPQDLRFASFQHVFSTGQHQGMDDGAQHGRTPLETFALANEFLESQLGERLHIPLPYFLESLRAWEAAPESQTLAA